MTQHNFNLEPGSHAGGLDEEALSEIWDHLYDDDSADPVLPEFDDETLKFFQLVNGAVPQNANADGIRIVRFLNFCNDYDPSNAKIADWHIVRNRRWIADRLDPFVIPIAELAHGDYLCLDFSTDGAPRVLRWIHEESRPGHPAYAPVAPDLRTFLAGI